MKTLLITPPYHAGVVEVAGKWVPLYLVYIAGALRAAGHEVYIYDAMTKDVGYPEIEAKIREIKPNMVCTTAITCTSIDATKILELAKQIDPDIKTLCGGIHATFMYEEMFSLSDAIDYIVVGEGEVTVVELAKALDTNSELSDIKGLAYRKDNKTVFTGKRGYIQDLNNMPMAWDTLDWEDYTYFILPGSRLGAMATSRGCEKDCTFCSQQKFWEQTWRARSPEDLIREMKELIEDYGVDVILFTDDYPTPDKERWEKFLDLIIKNEFNIHILMETRAEDIIRDREILHKYRKAGIIHIYIGTEAIDDKALEYMKKDLKVTDSRLALDLCREAGILTETSMILGFPDDTPESIQRTIDTVREQNPDFGHFLALAPWPYADIYKEMEPYIAIKDYREYNLVTPVIKPKNMTLEEVDEAIIAGYRDFYMNKFMQMQNTKDEFVRDYMMKAMKRMMSNSFIKKKLGMAGEMPKEMQDIINSKMG
ncbi:cobalamin-dependent protein [Nitrospirota bacterium]